MTIASIVSTVEQGICYFIDFSYIIVFRVFGICVSHKWECIFLVKFFVVVLNVYNMVYMYRYELIP